MKKSRMVLAMSIGTLALSIFPIKAANAATGDLVCDLAGTIHFSTPLFAGGTTDVYAEAPLTGCFSPNGNYPNLTGGTYEAHGTATAGAGLDPCSLLVTISTQVEITWNDGSESYADSYDNFNPAVGTLAINLTYRNYGALPGDKVLVAPVIIPNADCLTNGLKTFTVPYELYSVN